MRWILDQPYAAFDTETTGVQVATDRIVTAALLAITPADPDEPTSQRTTRTTTWTVNPGIPIPVEASNIHGITDDIAERDGQPIETALPEIAAVLAVAAATMPIVIMNAPYDLTLLDYNLRTICGQPLRHWLDLSTLHVIDPQVIDTFWWPYRKAGERTLTALAGHYRVPVGEAHNAAGDTLTAARVVYRMAQLATEPGRAAEHWRPMLGQPLPPDPNNPDGPAMYPADKVADYHKMLRQVAQVGTLDPQGLHRRQALLRMQQQQSRREWLLKQPTRKDEAAGISISWPIQRHPDDQ